MLWTDTPLEDALSRLHAGGLNQCGVTGVDAYDAQARDGLHSEDLAPWARSILVFASGGGGLWDGMLDAIRSDPSRLTCEPHPLDAHVVRLVGGASLPDVQHRWFLATATAPVQLDFRLLASLAGLGASSRLGLVINGEVGPWLGLRAACFVDVDLPASAPAPDVCEGCPAPCIGACPAGALGEGAWEVGTCAAFHRSASDCAQTCHSREACPVGAAHRYSDLERGYHYNRAAGREALRAYLGIPPDADPHQGIGPHWGAWEDA